jgi:hypothetical protein
VPAELAQSEQQTAELYRYAAGEAGIECPAGRDAAMLIRPVEFGKSTLYLLINESGRPQSARLPGKGPAGSIRIDVAPERIAMVLVHRKTGAVLARMD